MYFCKDENVYKPNNTQTLYSFCAELIDLLSDCLANKPENETITIIGKFNGKYLHARKGSTANSLVNDYKLQCSYTNDPVAHAPVKNDEGSTEQVTLSIEGETMIKIEDVLIASGLEYWTYYDPIKHTYIIKFGKDLEIND